MFDFFRARREKVLRGKVLDAIRTNKAEQLHVLLSKDKVKKLIRKSGGKVLSHGLYRALAKRCFECVEELLKAGVYLGIVDNWNPVSSTVHMKEGRFLKLLLDYGANPDSGQELPLYRSACEAELGIFGMLLLYGADPDYNCSDREFLNVTPDAITVLGMCLAKNYEVPFVKLLIQFGANMYSPDVQDILIHTDNEAATFLNRERVHPRSLMSQCRITIRRLLIQVGKLRLLDRLQIPNNLVRYLQYHNELSYPEKLPRYYVQ